MVRPAKTRNTASDLVKLSVCPNQMTEARIVKNLRVVVVTVRTRDPKVCGDPSVSDQVRVQLSVASNLESVVDEKLAEPRAQAKKEDIPQQFGMPAGS